MQIATERLAVWPHLRELGDCLVVIVTLGVMAQRLTANRVSCGNSSVNAQCHKRIADFGFVVSELSDRFRGVSELTSLPEPTS